MPRPIVLLVLALGCGDKGGESVVDAPDVSADARIYDFSCLTTPTPTIAPDPTSVAGTVRSYEDGLAVSGVGVAVQRASDDLLLGTDVTDTNGAYQTSAATGGAAIEVYRRLTLSGFVTTRVYSIDILYRATILDNLLMTTAARAASATAFGVTLDPTTGVVAAVVRDCANAPVAGAQIAVSPPGTNIGYYDGGAPAPGRTSTGSDGFAFAYGLPPGTSTVGVIYGTTVWRARPVAVEADGISLSFRQP